MRSIKTTDHFLDTSDAQKNTKTHSFIHFVNWYRKIGEPNCSWSSPRCREWSRRAVIGQAGRLLVGSDNLDQSRESRVGEKEKEHWREDEGAAAKKTKEQW